MFNFYKVSGIFSDMVIIEKNNDEYFKLEKENVIRIDKEKFNIRKAIRVEEYFFNKNELNELERIFGERKYFEDINYKNLFFFYNINKKEIIIYIDNFRIEIYPDGSFKEYNNIKLNKDNIFEIVKKDLDNENIVYKDLKLNEFKMDINKNKKDYLNYYSNEQLINIFIEENKDKIIEKEDCYEIEGCFLSYKDNIINLLNIVSMSYTGGGVRFYVKGSSDYTYLEIDKKSFREISKKYIGINNKYLGIEEKKKY